MAATQRELEIEVLTLRSLLASLCVEVVRNSGETPAEWASCFKERTHAIISLLGSSEEDASDLKAQAKVKAAEWIVSAASASTLANV